MIINIKKLSDKAIIPTAGSENAAGMDLYALTWNTTRAKRIESGETVKIGTGIAVEIPTGYFGAVFARSGIATKQGLRPANCVGIIDSDYRGEIIIALHNDSSECYTVRDGDRIAQLIVIPYQSIMFNEVQELEPTQRNDGGFGSTGVSNVGEHRRRMYCWI